MSTVPNNPDRSELQNYMSMFRDIHRAATIIADSIRVRESRALKLLGLQRTNEAGALPTDASDPHRCPVCLLEFHDPTVISKICGHGMHQNCAKRYISNADGPLLCSICRTPFHEDDLILLRGVLPPDTEAAAWRFVHLTTPWELSNGEQNPDPKTHLDSSAERLLINIKFLLNHQRNFSRVMSATLESLRRATNDEVTTKARLRRKKAELVERERRLEEAEDKLLVTKVQNEDFVAKCADNIQYEESYLLKIMESLSRRQNKLTRSLTDLAAREEDIHTKIKDFDTRQKKEEDVIRNMREEIRAEKEKLEAIRERGDLEARDVNVANGTVYDVDEWNPEEFRLTQTPVRVGDAEGQAGNREDVIIDETPTPLTIGTQRTGTQQITRRKRSRRI